MKKKKDITNTGGKVLMEKKGRQYFVDLANKRWNKVDQDKKKK